MHGTPQPPPQRHKRFLRPWLLDGLIVLAGALLLLAWDTSGADLRVMRWLGSADGFAWKEHWLSSKLLHEGGRWLSFAALLALLLNVWRPLPGARLLPRATRLWWLLATLGSLLLVPYVKSRSLVSCPWDLAEFGGAARHLSHWALAAWQGPGDGGAGRCFPSGHASGAFAFVAGWFALRAQSANAARRWLLGVTLLGLLFGATQVLRGAHYPSHVAWTAWLCWTFGAAAWHLSRLPVRVTAVKLAGAEAHTG